MPLPRNELLGINGFEAHGENMGKGLARLNPEDIKGLNATLGDVAEIAGEGNVAPSRGILPAGPSGTGKTIMAEALAISRKTSSPSSEPGKFK